MNSLRCILVSSLFQHKLYPPSFVTFGLAEPSSNQHLHLGTVHYLLVSAIGWSLLWTELDRQSVLYVPVNVSHQATRTNSSWFKLPLEYLVADGRTSSDCWHLVVSNRWYPPLTPSSCAEQSNWAYQLVGILVWSGKQVEPDVI